MTAAAESGAIGPGFTAASAVRPLGAGRFAVEVDPTWLQGPGAFGGLVAAWLVRAMEAAVAEPAGAAGAGPERPLRALSVVFCAPVKPGPAEVTVEVLRAGLGVSFLAAALRRRDRLLAHATATFGRARPEVVDDAPPSMPAVPPPAGLPRWAPAVGLPVYCQHVGHARCVGQEIVSGPAAEAALGGWTWFLEPTPDDAAARVALLDAWPPALFVRLARPWPVGTVSMHCALVGPPAPAVPPGTPLLVAARSRATREGFSEEEGALWAPDGRLLATSHQVIAVHAEP